MICQKCQTQLPDDAVFCNVCGETLAVFTPPEGFTLDPNSGLYYMLTPGVNPETGASGQWVTWFYPDTGEYQQSFDPSQSAAPVGADAFGEPQSQPRQKKGGLIMLLPVAALLIGIGIAFLQSGGLSYFQSDDIPDSIVTTDFSNETDPAFYPNGGDNAGEQGEDGSEPDVAPGTSGEQPSEPLSEPTSEPPPEPTPEPTAEPDSSFRSWGEVSINVTASSTLEPFANYNYHAENVLDGSINTAWVEGASGHGLGEWIMISTVDGAPALINYLAIRNGYQRTDTTYTNNSRVRTIDIEFSDGSYIGLLLDDSKKWQDITPLGMDDEPYVQTSYIKITITDVYPGTRYEDTCISGIDVW